MSQAAIKRGLLIGVGAGNRLAALGHTSSNPVIMWSSHTDPGGSLPRRYRPLLVALNWMKSFFF